VDELATFLREVCPAVSEAELFSGATMADTGMGGFGWISSTGSWTTGHVPVWEAVRERIDAGTMPPKNAEATAQ
jgi:hypothetical protein